MDPPGKKIKSQEPILQTIDQYIKKINETTNLRAVLGSDFTDPLPLIKVYTGLVHNPKDLSRIILTLNEKVPLKDLSHLKRVRKKEVILCPVDGLNEIFIQDFLEKNIPSLSNAFEYFREIDVPMIPPKVKKQWSTNTWSLNFHPNKYYEKLVSDHFFSPQEMKLHNLYMEIVCVSAKWYLENRRQHVSDLKDINITIVIDPIKISNTIVAVACNSDHPMQHSTMVAIDNVAKTQKGGVWNVKESSTSAYNFNGIDEELLKYLKDIYPNVKFGARNFVRKGEDTNIEGPYLCTGYYVYMLREPCVMCSMALVHARAKRIFYSLSNEDLGGVSSVCKLQSVASLNHHFEVFTGFLNEVKSQTPPHPEKVEDLSLE